MSDQNIAQLIATLDASDASRLLRVLSPAEGYYELHAHDGSVEQWVEAREWIQVLDVDSQPLQGWASEGVTWTNALLVLAPDVEPDPFWVFVGQEDEVVVERGITEAMRTNAAEIANARALLQRLEAEGRALTRQLIDLRTTQEG